MAVPRFLRPTAIAGDLKAFFAQRHPHQYVFGALALVATVAVLWALQRDSDPGLPEPPAEIIYVQQWPATRTREEIVAQQKVDVVKERAARLEREAKAEERRQEFRRVADAFGIEVDDK